MDDFSQEATTETMAGAKGYRNIVIKAEKAGSETFELVYVRSWEYKDFIERSSNGSPVSMKDVPNAGYRKIVL